MNDEVGAAQVLKQTNTSDSVATIAAAGTEQITTANVSTLSTYELRQELERRNAMDIEDRLINHKALLQRLIVELVKDEKQLSEMKVNADAAKVHDEREAEKQLREQRKQEALERSRARQKDPAYFSRLAELNQEGKQMMEAKKADPAPTSTEDEEKEEEDGAQDDPFRTSTSKKQRQKIFVR